MPRNFEIKVRHPDLPSVARLADAIGATHAGTLVQVDTFYRSTTGRLKLREILGDHAELIWYDRPDLAGSKTSDYIVTPVSDPHGMHLALDQACGTRGRVRKRRVLLLWRNVRIHLDDVEALGSFVELESVVASVDEPTAQANLAELARRLGLDQCESIAGAYADLLRI